MKQINIIDFKFITLDILNKKMYKLRVKGVEINEIKSSKRN